MRFYLLFFIYLCISTILSTIITSATETSVRPRGIKKIDIPLYTATTFSCRSDPSIIIPISHINDDYCDCADGSDEPGTSACDNGRFWCKNVGWRGELVKASRVNDGICDCCDGSDEWAGLITCPNTCIELGKAQGEDQLAKIQKMEAGAAKRAELIAEAERVAAERKAKKDKYEARLVEKAAILDEVKQKKEAAEAIEAEEKRIADEAQAAKDAEEARIAAEKAEAEAAAAAAEALANPPVEGVVTETAPKTPSTDPVPVPESAPVEVEIPSSGIAGVGMAGIGMAGVGIKPIEPVESFPYPAEYAYNPNAETKPTEPAEDPVLKEAASDDDYNDEEEPAAAEPAIPAEPTRTEAQQAADAARSQFNEIESSHRKTQDKLEKVKKLIDNDYGVNREFTMLEGQCYQIVIRQYTYEVCPYDESRQIEGSSRTSLGRYSGWHDRVIDPLQPADKQHVYGRIMEFTGGQSCWNGPQRSANIEFECGEDTAVLTVDEPSRCVYAMRMSTPAVCQPDEIAALRMKLEEQLKLTAESEE